MSSRVFAPGLLDGQVVLVSGPGPAVTRELGELGAEVITCKASEDEEWIDGFVDGALEEHGQIDTLVNCASGEDFRLSVEGTWLMTHAVATKSMIPDSRGGKLVNIIAGPPPVRSALENLARVLSVEWARFGIKPTAVAAGTAEETAWLAAFLASPAGDYVSGALLGSGSTPT
jgi:citronellol/citronellal dehydrogenase